MAFELPTQMDAGFDDPMRGPMQSFSHLPVSLSPKGLCIGTHMCVCSARACMYAGAETHESEMIHVPAQANRCPSQL